MLSYELCRKLKEAGYPNQIVFVCNNKSKIHEYCNADTESCKLEALNPPTLSELIEACGDEFDCLAKSRLLNGQPNRLQPWSAWKIQKDKSIFENIAFSGLTPEEAVANLLIVLLEKRNAI